MRRGIVFLVLVLGIGWLGAAQAQSVNELANIQFGRVVVPQGGALVDIDPNNTVVMGSQWIITPPNPRRGRYRFQGGGAGSADISVDAMSTCDGAVTIDDFDAIWMATTYGDISATPLVGVVYDNNEVLQLGARITYSDTVPIGVCNVGFDLNFVRY